MPTLESDKGWKEELGRLLDEPNSSKRAKAFAVTMGGLVVLSVLLLVIQTMPRYRDTFICEPAIEFVFNSIFSLELIARLVASGGRVDVFTTFDVLAIAPFWVEHLLRSANASVNIFKSLRMLRLLKLSRSYGGSIVIYRALRLSIAALGVPAFFLAVAVIVFSAFLYYLELTMATDDKPAAYDSIPDAIWYMLVPLTSNSGGDKAPASELGRIVTVCAMVFGVLFLSMPLAIVGNNFCLTWDDRNRVIFIEQFKDRVFRHEKFSRAALEKVFQEIDTDGVGSLDFEEFRTMMERLHVQMSLNEMLDVWRAIDVNMDNSITKDEFVKLFFDDAKETGSSDAAAQYDLENLMSGSGADQAGGKVRSVDLDDDELKDDPSARAATPADEQKSAQGGGTKKKSTSMLKARQAKSKGQAAQAPAPPVRALGAPAGLGLISKQLDELRASFETTHRELLFEQVRMSTQIDSIVATQRRLEQRLSAVYGSSSTADGVTVLCGGTNSEEQRANSEYLAPSAFHGD